MSKKDDDQQGPTANSNSNGQGSKITVLDGGRREAKSADPLDFKCAKVLDHSVYRFSAAYTSKETLKVLNGLRDTTAIDLVRREMEVNIVNTEKYLIQSLNLVKAFTTGRKALGFNITVHINYNKGDKYDLVLSDCTLRSAQLLLGDPEETSKVLTFHFKDWKIKAGSSSSSGDSNDPFDIVDDE
jgi:hypothetical protein